MTIKPSNPANDKAAAVAKFQEWTDADRRVPSRTPMHLVDGVDVHWSSKPQPWMSNFHDRRAPKKPQGGEPGLTSL